MCLPVYCTVKKNNLSMGKNLSAFQRSEEQTKGKQNTVFTRFVARQLTFILLSQYLHAWLHLHINMLIIQMAHATRRLNTFVQAGVASNCSKPATCKITCQRLLSWTYLRVYKWKSSQPKTTSSTKTTCMCTLHLVYLVRKAFGSSTIPLAKAASVSCSQVRVEFRRFPYVWTSRRVASFQVGSPLSIGVRPQAICNLTSFSCPTNTSVFCLMLLRIYVPCFILHYQCYCYILLLLGVHSFRHMDSVLQFVGLKVDEYIGSQLASSRCIIGSSMISIYLDAQLLATRLQFMLMYG